MDCNRQALWICRNTLNPPAASPCSVHSSSYENLSIFLSPFLKRLPGANVETSSKDARATSKATELNENELTVPLDVKSLYTYVQIEKSFEIAFKELYSSVEILEIPRSALKRFLKLAATTFQFKRN